MADLPAYSPRFPGASTTTLPPPYSGGRQSATDASTSGTSRPRRRPGSSRSTTTSEFHRPSYSIGKKHTPALIAPADLKSHITLLRAFHSLREEVLARSKKVDVLPGQVAHKPDDVWRWYLSRAVWRFEIWLAKVIDSGAEPTQQATARRWADIKEIPPVDVMMVWHAYILHPRVYFEDGLRYHPKLLARGSFPLHECATVLEQDDPYQPGSPAQERAYHWESCTGQPWYASTSPNDDASHRLPLACPFCGTLNRVDWLDHTDTGWSQDGFASKCEGCDGRITKEAIGVHKFTEDLYRVVEERRKYTLASMLLDPDTGRPSMSSSQLFHENLIKGLSKASFSPSLQAFAETELQWRLAKVVERIAQGFRATISGKAGSSISPKDSWPPGLQRIVGAYTVPGPFSIDLVGAVRRHMRFVDQIVRLGWTEAGKFDDSSDESMLALKRAVAQYHAFLDIMETFPGQFLVPTLTIDLAWHTHQLLCVEYRESTLTLLGTIVDHDDAVEQENLSAAFETTAFLWTNKYNVPYVICGCPVPCHTAKQNRMGAMTSKLFGRKGKAKAVATDTPVVNPRPDLVSPVGKDVYETHPSDHAQVILANHPSVSNLVSAREKTKKKRLAEDQDAVEGGVADGWQSLVVGLRKAAEHADAFAPDESETDILDANTMPLGACIVGIGAAGMCQGGNSKARVMPTGQDADIWSQLTFPEYYFPAAVSSPKPRYSR